MSTKPFADTVEPHFDTTSPQWVEDVIQIAAHVDDLIAECLQSLDAGDEAGTRRRLLAIQKHLGFRKQKESA